MKRSLARPLIYVAVFVAGVFAGHLNPTARAEPLRGGVVLGISTQRILELDGPPIKISSGTEDQLWFYPTADGGIAQRYRINQGVVIDIKSH